MMQTFSGTLTALSSMITPAVLILASGQLILTTSQRLARTMDRIRKLSEMLEELTENHSKNTKKKQFLYMLLGRSARRAKKLQQSMSILYTALSLFVCTSVTIGLLDVFDVPLVWIPIALGLAGIGFMFYATILLITETRVAVGSVNREVAYLTGKDLYDLD